MAASNNLEYLLDTYFVLNPIWVIISVASGLIAFILLEGRRSRRKRRYAGAVIAYCVLVLFYTVIGRGVSSTFRISLIPFWSYLMVAAGRGSLEQIFLNYLLFIPIGVMMPRLHSYQKTVKGAFIFSTIIEVLQLVTMRGTFETDDIIGNTLGCIIGCVICHQIRSFKTQMSKKYNSIFA